jgi:hypothetical protein
MKQFVLAHTVLAATHCQGQHKQAENQQLSCRTTEFGFKAGFNRSQISGRDSDQKNTGYIGGELYAGFFSETTLNKRLGLGSELLFSWTDDYHFVEIPLLLKYRVATRWSLFAGPKLELLVDNDNNDDRYQFNNAGVAAEGGLQFKFGRSFIAEVRHSRSFIRQVDDLFLDINAGRRNTTRIGIGIMF